MLIYQGSTDEFVQLNRMNRIADVMDETYFSFTGRHAEQSEYNSWQNSLTRVRGNERVLRLFCRQGSGGVFSEVNQQIGDFLNRNIAKTFLNRRTHK